MKMLILSQLLLFRNYITKKCVLFFLLLLIHTIIYTMFLNLFDDK